MHDLRHMTCGLVPRLRQALESLQPAEGPLEALVEAKSVAAVVESLGLLWRIEVREEGDAARLRFLPDVGRPVDDPLNRV